MDRRGTSNAIRPWHNICSSCGQNGPDIMSADFLIRKVRRMDSNQSFKSRILTLDQGIEIRRIDEFHSHRYARCAGRKEGEGSRFRLHKIYDKCTAVQPGFDE